MQRLLLFYLVFFPVFSVKAQITAERSIMEIKSDTVNTSGYLIKTTQPYCFFLPSNDTEYKTIGKLLDRYYPRIRNWDPKNFKSSHVYMFNPDSISVLRHSFFEDDDLYFPGLNDLAQKKILPELISRVKYKKKKDDRHRAYEIFYLEARWLRLKMNRYCGSIRSQSTISPDCTNDYFYCYILLDYSSLLPITHLDDKQMVQIIQNDKARW